MWRHQTVLAKHHQGILEQGEFAPDAAPPPCGQGAAFPLTGRHLQTTSPDGRQQEPSAPVRRLLQGPVFCHLELCARQATARPCDAGLNSREPDGRGLPGMILQQPHRRGSNSWPFQYMSSAAKLRHAHVHRTVRTSCPGLFAGLDRVQSFGNARQRIGVGRCRAALGGGAD